MKTRSVIVVGILVTGIAVSVVLALPHHARSKSVSPVRPDLELNTGAASTKAGPAGRKAPEFYGENVRSGLFSRPLLPPRPPAQAEVRTAPSAPPNQISADPPDPDIFEGITYTGTVTIDGQMQALLESAGTKNGLYVHPGDTFLGAVVTQIDADAVTLDVNGQTRRIPKSGAYNLTPLNAQANSQPDKSGSGSPTPGGAQLTVVTAANEAQAAYQALLLTATQGGDESKISMVTALTDALPVYLNNDVVTESK